MDPSGNESEIRDYVSRIASGLGLEPPGDDESLRAAGILDSLFIVEVSLIVERLRGRQLSEEEMKAENFETTNSILALLKGRNG